MIESFKNWFEDKGLADQDFVSKSLRIKNKIIPNKYKLPDTSLWRIWDQDPSMGKKIESEMPGLASQSIKDLANWNAANHVDGSNQMPKARIFPDKVKRIDKKGIPHYRFDVTKTTATRLDQ